MIRDIDNAKCTGCGICVDWCPEDVIRLDTKTEKANIAYPEDCRTCYRCELNCPEGAIYVHPFKAVLPSVLK